MYTLAIADDNHKICDGIAAFITQYRPDIKIIGVYHDGKELIQSFATVLPDILICDIQMPYTDGIEVCSYIRRRAFHTQIILITGHKKFEYAKSAIDYKVLHFLIKPYTSTQLLEAIDSALLALKETDDYIQKSKDDYFEKYQHVRQEIIDIYQGVRDALTVSDLLLQIHSRPIYECYVQEAEIAVVSGITELLDYFEHDSAYLTVFCVDTVPTYKLIAFFTNEVYAENYFTDLFKTAAMNQCQISITRTSRMEFNTWCTLCRIRKLSTLLKDAVASVTVRAFYTVYKKQIEALNTAEFSELLLTTFHDLCPDAPYTFVLNKNAPYDETLYAFDEYCLQNRRKPSLSQLIKQYILKNFMNSNLSVSSIAEHFNLNSNYVSGCFKKESGMSLTDFINSTRIERAKELLLKETTLSNETVARRVGYNDIKYFQKVFKRYMHITPKQFRKRDDTL